MGGVEVLGAGIFLIFGGLWVAALVYWIIVLVEVARIPDFQYRAAGSEKITWVLVVVLTQIIGALIWRFAKRDEVRAAAGRLPPPAPGWYPEPGGASLRWWDGYRWTEARQASSPPPAPPN